MVVYLFGGLAIVFIAIGALVLEDSNTVVEHVKQYDGAGTSNSLKDCKYNNEASCTITFTIDEKMEAPVYLYYELTNFYQNHRRYAKSYLAEQLLGTVFQKGSSALDYCEPLTQNGSLVLNPCGLIANTLFNDKITLSNTTGASGVSLKTTGIAWPSDKQDKFAQPQQYCKKSDSGSLACDTDAAKTGTDYQFAKVWVGDDDSQIQSCIGSRCSDTICDDLGLPDGCRGYYCDEPDYYNCDEGYWAYYYPEDEYQQYLYETFPEVVSPLEGANNEHFIVWMRTAALPTFRKLYGRITEDLPKGSTISFDVDANFDVTQFKGTKSLVLSTTTVFGGKNDFFGTAFIVVGSVCVAVAIALQANLSFYGARKAGDRVFLD